MESEQALAELREVSSLSWPIEVFSQLPSTQKLALERVGGGRQVIVAVEQTAGQGRHGRAWGSPAGGLWLSLIDNQVASAEGLSLLAGLAVIRVVQSLGLDPWMRWPNDVMVGSLKLAGVLVDAKWAGFQGTAVVGIGLNVDIDPQAWTPEMEGVATTLTQLGVSRPHLGRLLLSLIDQWSSLAPHGLAAVHDTLTHLVVGEGRQVEVQDNAKDLAYRDRMSGLAPDGALLLASGRKLYSVERLKVL
jgi:biotin-[acetyl-CoA-carboxylase] ligase BirA-like protein